MATINDVAKDFTDMLRTGQFQAAGNRYWAADVTSIEPDAFTDGICVAVSGIEATRRKCDARFGGLQIREIAIDGPFVTGDQFALFLDLVIVDPTSGTSQPFTEIALYTIRSGKIAEERYFYD